MEYNFKIPDGCEHPPEPLQNLGAYSLVKKHLKNNRTALDIGGHIGTMSRIFSNDFEQVHSFEPLWAEYLRENTSDLNNVKIEPVGIGNSIKEEKMYILPRNTGGSTMVKHPGRTWISSAEEKKINIYPLDHFELENVDFIKIDVESYEYFVIDGARKTLEKNSPVIMIEFIEKYEHPEFTVNETKFLLDQLGYISVGYVHRDWVYIKEQKNATMGLFKS